MRSINFPLFIFFILVLLGLSISVIGFLAASRSNFDSKHFTLMSLFSVLLLGLYKGKWKLITPVGNITFTFLLANALYNTSSGYFDNFSWLSCLYPIVSLILLNLKIIKNSSPSPLNH
jgi:hypothetical protein